MNPALILIYLLAVLVLYGCTWPTRPDDPPTRVDVREVRVPIIQPCVDPEDIDPLPASAMPAKDKANDEQLVNGLFVDVEHLLARARDYRDMLVTCSKMQKVKKVTDDEEAK